MDNKNEAREQVSASDAHPISSDTDLNIQDTTDARIVEVKAADIRELETDTSEVLDLALPNAVSYAEESFSVIPEAATEFKAIDAEDIENAERTENTASDSLPRAESLDSILYDSHEDSYSEPDDEEYASYESTIADYRRAMKEAFSAISASSGNEQDDEAPLLVKDKSTTSESENAEHQVEATFEESSPVPAIEEVYDEVNTDISSFSEDVTGDGFTEEETEQMVMDFGEIPLSESYEDESAEAYEEPSRKAPSKLDEKYDPEKPRKVDSVFELVELFIFTLAAVLILATFFFRHSIVSGGSMDDTLANGEHLIITDFLYTPKRGDIIVFEDREAGIDTPYIKRVIGIPGDTVRIEADGSVYVNDKLLDEKYVTHKPITNKELSCTVGEGELFVMGDQRKISEDSRSFGKINDDGVLGKVILRIYPFSKFGTVE